MTYSITSGRNLKLDEKRGGAGDLAFVIPIVIFSIIPLICGWIAARRGYRYRTVKFWILPMAFMWANIMAVAVLGPILFMGQLMGYSDGTLLMNWFHCTLIKQFFFPLMLNFWTLIIPTMKGWIAYGQSDVKISGIWVILYQVGVWYVFGKWFARSIAGGLYDLATVKIARANGEDPGALRVYRAEHDAPYLKDAMYYEQRQRWPWVGGLLLLVNGQSPSDYYD